MRIKAISLWQPWASLVAVGAKRFETRGWETKHRGPLAIHAAQRWTKEQHDLCNESPFSEALAEYWKHSVHWLVPLGCVVAVCELVCCFATDDFDTLHMTEAAFGDWSPGRFAWRLENVRRIEPVPCKGRQGFFWVEI